LNKSRDLAEAVESGRCLANALDEASSLSVDVLRGVRDDEVTAPTILAPVGRVTFRGGKNHFNDGTPEDGIRVAQGELFAFFLGCLG
jgi:hypothetical protein